MSEQISQEMTNTNTSPAGPPLAHGSIWHSPVPYLLGGLAAMLGLIVFALLILACSYINESNNTGENTNSSNDLEGGEIANSQEKQKIPNMHSENVLVIMAGQALPTFLAMPVASRASLSDCSSNTGNCDKVQSSTLETHETLHHSPT